MKSIYQIGQGKVKVERGQAVYEGTLPFINSEDVFVLRQGDLEKIVKNVFDLIRANKIEMRSGFAEIFPDQIDFTPEDSSENTSLYLDRAFYTEDMSKHLWIRYASMDTYVSEGDLNKEAKSPKHDIEEDVVEQVDGTFNDWNETYDIEMFIEDDLDDDNEWRPEDHEI